MTEQQVTRDQASADADAERAHAELREALRQADITLPSLGVDLPPHDCLVHRPLIDLGRCNLATAQQLAAALRRGVHGTGARP